MTRPPKRFPNYVALTTSILETKLFNFKEANVEHVWHDAMVEEYDSIIKNDVKEVIPRPFVKSMIDSRWLYKIKHDIDGSIGKFKSMFVARGFFYKEGVDYDETFALVARYTSIRTVMSLACCFSWSLYFMDVKATSMNGASFQL
jgi:hypothetical protein